MHELAVTQELVALACAEAQRALPGARVRRLRVEVGKLSTILPESVASCFPLCAEGTAAEGAELELAEVPGRARCRSCAGEFALERPYGACACGSTDLEWLSGEDLTITEMEVVPCA